MLKTYIQEICQKRLGQVNHSLNYKINQLHNLEPVQEIKGKTAVSSNKRAIILRKRFQSLDPLFQALFFIKNFSNKNFIKLRNLIASVISPKNCRE